MKDYFCEVPLRLIIRIVDVYTVDKFDIWSLIFGKMLCNQFYCTIDLYLFLNSTSLYHVRCT